MKKKLLKGKKRDTDNTKANIGTKAREEGTITTRQGRGKKTGGGRRGTARAGRGT